MFDDFVLPLIVTRTLASSLLAGKALECRTQDQKFGGSNPPHDLWEFLQPKLDKECGLRYEWLWEVTQNHQTLLNFLHYSTSPRSGSSQNRRGGFTTIFAPSSFLFFVFFFFFLLSSPFLKKFRGGSSPQRPPQMPPLRLSAQWSGKHRLTCT